MQIFVFIHHLLNDPFKILNTFWVFLYIHCWRHFFIQDWEKIDGTGLCLLSKNNFCNIDNVIRQFKKVLGMGRWWKFYKIFTFLSVQTNYFVTIYSLKSVINLINLIDRIMRIVTILLRDILFISNFSLGILPFGDHKLKF